MFVTGTLYAAGGSMPVRIRNLSTRGALVEAAALPQPGTIVRLSRGRLSVAGEVMWVEGRKGGLQLASQVAALDWLPLPEREHGQPLTDDVMHGARLGAVPSAPPQAGPPTAPGLRAELVRLQQILHRAGEELAAEELMSAAQVIAVQAMDGVANSLGKLAADVAQALNER